MTTPYVPILYTYPRCSRHPGRQRWFMFLPDGSSIGPAAKPETLTARLDAECRRAEERERIIHALGVEYGENE